MSISYCDYYACYTYLFNLRYWRINVFQRDIYEQLILYLTDVTLMSFTMLPSLQHGPGLAYLACGLCYECTKPVNVLR